MYQPMDVRGTARRRSPMSVRAWSQVSRSKSPPGVLRSGCSTRSGAFCTSVIAIPFGHAYPCESGCAGSGRSRSTRPPSTVATSPQCASQMRQKVMCCSAGMRGDQFREPLRAILGHVDVGVVDELERRPEELREPAAVADRVDERALGLPYDE